MYEHRSSNNLANFFAQFAPLKGYLFPWADLLREEKILDKLGPFTNFLPWSRAAALEKKPLSPFFRAVTGLCLSVVVNSARPFWDGNIMGIFLTDNKYFSAFLGCFQ